MAMAPKVARPQTYVQSTGDGDAMPILCDTCLGPQKYVRMQRMQAGQECKICERPFTVFRCQAGREARHKKTQICQTCARLKNVCQTCIFDLQYGLPVQVRDALQPMSQEVVIPKSAVTKEYTAQEMERKLATMNAEDSLVGAGGPEGSEGAKTLKALARTGPYYKRNRAHICSFYVAGTCTRGKECPYRHEKPTENELSDQNLKDRYYGVNDPVAKKIMRQHEERQQKVQDRKDEDQARRNLGVASGQALYPSQMGF